MIDFAAVSTIQFCLAVATFHGALPAWIGFLIVRTQQGQVHQLVLFVRQQHFRLCDRLSPSGCGGWRLERNLVEVIVNQLITETAQMLVAMMQLREFVLKFF